MGVKHQVTYFTSSGAPLEELALKLKSEPCFAMNEESYILISFQDYTDSQWHSTTQVSQFDMEEQLNREAKTTTVTRNRVLELKFNIIHGKNNNLPGCGLGRRVRFSPVRLCKLPAPCSQVALLVIHTLVLREREREKERERERERERIWLAAYAAYGVRKWEFYLF